MNYTDFYIITYPDVNIDLDKEVIVKLESIKEVYKVLTELSSVKINTRQSILELTRVFPKGSAYPVSYEKFWEEKRSKQRTKYLQHSTYLVDRTLKNLKNEQRYYDWAEDFDWKLEKWDKEKTLILNMAESLSGDYIYRRDVQKQWGEKTALFV